MASAKAEKYRELREARGYSVDELSHHMGVPAERVRRWESGDEDVDEATLEQLARHLNVSQDALRHAGDEAHHGHGG